MSRFKTGLPLGLLLTALAWGAVADAQGMPTAIQRRQLSVFGAVSADFTGLAGGRNIGLTGGIDLGLLNFHGVRPVIEARGRYPVSGGTIDAQKVGMGGLRVDLLLGRRIRPYVDGLFGRGSTTYENNGYLFNNFAYQLTTTNVFAGGGGLDFELSNHFAVKLDGQLEHWGAAPTSSGSINSTVGSVGVVYRFDFNRRH